MAARPENDNYTESQKITIASKLIRGREVHLYPRFFGDPSVDHLINHFTTFGYIISPRNGYHIIYPPTDPDY